MFLAPNGVTSFVFTDHGSDGYSVNSPTVAETIRPFPDAGLDDVDLVDRSSQVRLTVPVAIGAVLTLAAATGLPIRYRRTGSHG